MTRHNNATLGLCDNIECNKRPSHQFAMVVAASFLWVAWVSFILLVGQLGYTAASLTVLKHLVAQAEGLGFSLPAGRVVSGDLGFLFG